ncbi:MAG: NAD(P)/FAD-dependent oxidoreductase [Acidobacteriota bacterium]
MKTPERESSAPTELDYDVIVLGAGVGGIYQIKRLVDLGVRATVLESGDDLGGTWFWNRYPGARFDSESYTYGYSFSREVLDEWHWTERFSPQPENLKYLNFVAEKFGLRKHMQFGCRVSSMSFDEEGNSWRVDVAGGRSLTARFVVTAVGPLSIPTLPSYPGRDDFRGASFHTHDWPQEKVELEGQRVAVIGTGATAIQLIPEVAKEAAQLTVFQRRPNWAAPLNNGPISDEEMDDIRARYDEIFAACSRSPGGFEHEPDRRGFYNLTREERVALWDRLYDEPGFGIWLRNFVETFTEEAANQELSEYIADRIRQRVDDPDLAEKLIPKDHGFGYQRVPLETGYYETYNRDNVGLVDTSETPIEDITATGLRTSEEDFDFDVIVYATGFDALTGAYDRIDIRGAGGLTLRECWQHDASTYLGVLVSGFPNLLMVSGPQSGSASANFPRGIEWGVDWISDLLAHAFANGIERIDAEAEAQRHWTQEVVEAYEHVLLRKAQGWFTGYNSNLKGHEKGTMRHLIYNGGAPKYVARLEEVAERGYEGISFEVP